MNIRNFSLSKFKRIFRRKGTDKAIYGAVTVLAIFGIVMIGSASIGSAATKGSAYAIRNMVVQSAFVIVGYGIMMLLAKGFRTRVINYRTSMILFGIGIALMCVCILWSTNGSHAWIKISSFTIQPAEFMKVFMVLILSYMLTETDTAYVVKGKFKTKELKEAFYRDKFKKCFLLPLMLVVIVCVVGLFIQKDMGTTVILAIICFICFMTTPRTYYKKYKMLIWGIILVCGSVLGFLTTTLLKGYKLSRITSWLDPLGDPYYSSYQLVNALIAFSNGGIWGRGLGNSIQKYGYIPESHNDFIGAIIYEELGIIGLALIIIPTCIIIFRLLKYAREIQENKSRIVLVGVASYFFLHLIVNLGGVSGFIPMTGVPLLLVSYGGSSTWSALIGIGICQSIIAKYNKSKLDTVEPY